MAANPCSLALENAAFFRAWITELVSGQQPVFEKNGVHATLARRGCEEMGLAPSR